MLTYCSYANHSGILSAMFAGGAYASIDQVMNKTQAKTFRSQVASYARHTNSSAPAAAAADKALTKWLADSTISTFEYG